MRDAIAAARAPSLATMRAWREGAEYRAVEAAFADCPLDSAEPAAARAEVLLADAGLGEALLAPLVAALDRDWFFEPPFHVSRDALRVAAVLYEGPVAAITASLIEGAALATLPPSDTVRFSGRMTVTRYVRADGARLRRWRTEAATPGFAAADALPCVELPALSLADGDVHRLDGRTHAQLLARATSDLMMLVATIHAGAAPLVREHAVSDGALVRVASADDRASRAEMLLTLLRLAGRADAGERFAEATHDSAFHLRWAAMREWLALDARAALPRLAEMAAGDAHAEVRGAAATTLARVRRRLGEAACLA